MSVPSLRLSDRNAAPPARRTRWNFALEHAIDEALSMGRPLLVLEALRCDYRHACDRFHRFVTDGMADNAARFAAGGVAYVAYVEPRPKDFSTRP